MLHIIIAVDSPKQYLITFPYTILVFNLKETLKITFFPNETFTILCKDGNSYFISYSTANGPTLGYVFTGFMFDTYSTCMGIVTSYSSVYYGPDTTTYERSGSVNSGEYVAILASESNWYLLNMTLLGKKTCVCSRPKCFYSICRRF